MKKKGTLRFIGILLGAALAASAQLAPAPQGAVLVILRANVIDGVTAEALRDATVVVRNGRIEDVTREPVQVPAGATVVDLKGHWLLPGFVDAHAHVGDVVTARRALASGATTLRAMGVNRFADVGMRELNHAGVNDLPDVLAAGYHVRPRPAEEFFLDFPNLRDLMPGVSGPQAVRRMVRAMIDRGANWIKVMATERAGLPDTDPRKRVFTDEELAAAVDEARKAGIPVAAHAHGDEGARAAVLAGVRSIEHGTYLSEDTLRLMKERGTCLDPTIATVGDLIDVGGDYDNTALAIRGRAMLPRVRDTSARAWKMGVRVIAGTDTGYGPQSRRRMPDEVIELVGIGMPPMEAIKAATSLSAECLGVAKRTGSVRKGMEADLIAVDRNPLTDMGALQDVIVVINNGTLIVNRIVP